MTSSLLITGGLGYIGSHTVFERIGRGHEVVILDSLSNSSESVLGGIQKLTGKKPKTYIADTRDRDWTSQY
jgi:UDP-glucose 4-epimerase